MTPYVERAGRFYWQIVFPAAPGEGMAMARGPYFTRLGARIALRIHLWLR